MYNNNNNNNIWSQKLYQNGQDNRQCHKNYRQNNGNLEFELTSGEQILDEMKIQRGNFHGDALAQFLLVMVMIQLNDILRKYTGGYKLSKSQEKINHLMYKDDIKLSTKNEK